MKKPKLELVSQFTYLPGPMMEKIDVLLSTGLWGPDREDAIERLCAYALLELEDVITRAQTTAELEFHTDQDIPPAPEF